MAKNDPRWLRIKYKVHCSKCHAPIPAGERAFYFPSDKSFMCAKDTCGGQASRDFSAALFDERGY